MKRKVLAITGTRAEFGLMTPIYKAISENKHMDFHLIITGQHYLNRYSKSLEEVKCRNFGTKHEIIISDKNIADMASTYAELTIRLNQLIPTINPTLVLLQGDRIEMLALGIVAVLNNIPIFHMSGGDSSGSIDNSIRNAITAFAHIHLTSCVDSTKQLLRIGEKAKRIYEVGEPGLDVMRTMKFISKIKLYKEFNLKDNIPLILVLQHPVTTESQQSATQMETTLQAVVELGYQTIVIYPNNDMGSENMISIIDTYKQYNALRIIEHIEHEKYLSLMNVTSVLVGNSSSGIIEAPSLCLPFVNVGTRQHNRIVGDNVINVGYVKDEIKHAIQTALMDTSFQFAVKNGKNPYGSGRTSEKVLDILENKSISEDLLAKWIQ